MQKISDLSDQQPNESFDKFLAGSSVGSSVCSMIDNANGMQPGEDYYSKSILVSSMVKEPEDLIDSDLLQLLAYIKCLPLPSDEEIASKKIELGDVIRHKTLILDLDETLIHSKMLPPGAPPLSTFGAQADNA